MQIFNDIWIARMLGGTACASVFFAVLVIGIRVLLDGVGAPEMGQLTDALIKIALGGGFVSGGSLLAGKFMEGNQGGNKDNATNIDK